MKFTLALLASTALAAPHVKRQAAAITDADILQHLEDTFYSQAIANFSAADFTAAGFSSSVYDNIKEIAADEAAHVEFLTTGLTAAGASPVEACTYSFPYTDVKSFLGLSKVLEGVGVSAYAGAAKYIQNGDYLTAAAVILTVEARHAAYVQSVLKTSPFPAPFDTPLGFNEVYSLAASFITGCPDSNVALPVKAFPALTLAGPTPLTASSQISLTSAAAASNSSTPLYAAFFSGLNQYFVPFTGSNISIPEGVFAGQTYVVLTTSSSNATDENIVAGPAILNIDSASTYSNSSSSNSSDSSSGNGSGSGSGSDVAPSLAVHNVAGAAFALAAFGFASLLM